MQHEHVHPVTSVPEQQTNDAQLVEAARSGDQIACGALVERHFGMAWWIAYARLRNREAADELAQEVFLLALLHLDELLDGKRFAGWLSQIAHHRVIDWLRCKQTCSRVVQMVPLASLAEHVAAEQRHTLEQEEEHQAVRDALFALPEGQRELILLHFAEGLSQKEIADRLEVHPGTVGRKLQKAMAQMRSALESMIKESVRPMRVSPRTVARATLISAAVGGMSADTKAALIAAGGAMPKLAAVTWIGGAGKTAAGLFSAGVSVMTATKLAIGIAVLATLVAVGVGVYAGVSAATRPTATQVAASPPDKEAQPESIPPATPEQLQMVLAAARECFPPEVVTYLMTACEDAGRQLDPTGGLPVFPQASGLDHTGTRWLGVMKDGGPDDGSGRLDLSNTSVTDIAGVVTFDRQVIPLQRSKNPASSWGPYRMWAELKRPRVPGEMFGVLIRSGSVPAATDRICRLQLGNWPGPECIQQLILVLPPTWRVRSSSQPETSTQEVGTTTVHLWQKHLAAKEGLTVDVELERQK